MLVLPIAFALGQTPMSPQSSGQGSMDPSQPNPNGGFPDPKLTKTPTQSSKSGRAALDDSTKQIYGPNSTHYFLESDILNAKLVNRNIDTSLHLFHRYLFQEKAYFLTANLGNEGTAVRNIFVKSPNALGTHLGYNAYMPYAFDTDEVKYYNTKSPFSDIDYSLGGGGQTRLNFSFARNIDSLWNMGLELQRVVADKVLTDAAFKKGDQFLLGQWAVLLHSNYRSRNNKYRILGHFNYFDQGTNDQGGVKLTTGQTPTAALNYLDNTAILSNSTSQSNDQFLKFHVYHEFIGFKGLQFFQRFDLETRKVKYRDMDFDMSLADRFYPKTYINYIQAPSVPDSMYNENQWSSYSHQTGIKGVFRKFIYRAHLKQRYWSVYNPMNDAKLDRFENYLGLWLHQSFSDNIDFTAEGEYLLGSDYKLAAQFTSPWFYAKVQRTSSSPSIVQNWVHNISYRWKNDFDNIQFDVLEGGLEYKSKQFYVKPYVTIQRIGNWVYFDSLANVKQTNEAIGVFRTSVDLGGNFGKFEWGTRLHANTSSGLDIIRMPSFVANANLALNVQYKKLLYMQFGIDLQHQSAYYADAYMPAFQQYHLQDKFQLPAFVQADAYVNLRINRVRLFFKMSNVTQGLITSNYYTAYLHPAMGRVFGYGVKWLLFD